MIVFKSNISCFSLSLFQSSCHYILRDCDKADHRSLSTNGVKTFLTVSAPSNVSQRLCKKVENNSVDNARISVGHLHDIK